MTPKSNNLFRILIFLASTALLLFFLPHESANEYTYAVNRPWAYSLLTAPFDIPVHLDSVSAREVKDSIDAAFEPIYMRDLTVEKSMVSQFGSRLNSTAREGLSPADRNRILAAVKQIYEDGIVETDDYDAIRAGRLQAVRFIHDNVSISMPTDGYRSVRAAYARLDSTFSDPRFRRALAAIRPVDYLQPNILADTLETARVRTELYQKALAPIGVIQQGERIIDKGDIVTPRLARVLQTYEEMIADRGGSTASTYYPIAGQALFLILLLGALYAYLYIFRRDYYNDIKIICFIMMMIVGFTFFAYALALTFTSGLYLVPFAIVPIMGVIFLDSRTALFIDIVLILITSVIAVVPLEYIFIQFMAGTAAIDSIKDLSRRSQLIRTAFIVFVVYSLSYIAVEVMLNGSLRELSGRIFGYLAINAVAVSFAYILLFFFEKIFGFTSRVTLVELSDINNPLLRELSEECPGTFQHSMAVSNLASAAASRIGANVQLVRAGALYHDIGKIRNPAFYTENQHGVNPHDTLDPKQSARIVIGHVSEGMKMAEKAKIPMQLRRFITEHHGRGKARYFFNTWCNRHPDEEPDPDAFTYPGPNPTTRESSIIMMADSVEAASRSLTDHSPEAIQALVNKIVDTQVSEGLHNDSPISFRDVNQIKDTFAQRLRTIYHSRISYPDLNKQ